MSPEQLADLNSRSNCHRCSNFGPWSSDHNDHGSLNPHSIVTGDPSDNHNKSTANRNVVSFNMATVSADSATMAVHLGALMEDCTPYSSIGYYDL